MLGKQDLIVDINMRIKLFESFETDDYYVRIGSIQQDVTNLGFNTNYSSLVRFTDREKSRILNNIPEINPTRRVEDNIIEWDKHFCCLSISKGFNEWVIYRWGDDGWIWAYDDQMNASYRCDQMEGLFRLLKDKWIK